MVISRRWFFIGLFACMCLAGYEIMKQQHEELLMEETMQDAHYLYVQEKTMDADSLHQWVDSLKDCLSASNLSKLSSELWYLHDALQNLTPLEADGLNDADLLFHCLHYCIENERLSAIDYAEAVHFASIAKKDPLYYKARIDSIVVINDELLTDLYSAEARTNTAMSLLKIGLDEIPMSGQQCTKADQLSIAFHAFQMGRRPIPE